MTDRDLEPEIQRIGRDILSRIGERRTSVFDSGRWAGQILEWAIQDEGFKVAMFRLVDVLPSLRDPGDVVAIFAEYVRGMRLPKVLEWGLKRLDPSSMAGRLAGRALQDQVRALATLFIAADKIDRTGEAVAPVWNVGQGASVALLGEASVSESEADAYRERYIALIDALAVSARSAAPLATTHPLVGVPAVDVSVKASSLDSQIDPADWEGSLARLSARLQPILDRARTVGAHVHIDMEHYALKSLLLACCHRLLGEGPHRDAPAGLVIQAYLRDAEADLQEVVAWASRRTRPLTVRLVKGAYWDSEVMTAAYKGWPIPVLTDKVATDEQFERLVGILLQHVPAVRPAIGTHNVRSLAAAIAQAERLGLPRSAYELQLLYGMGEPIAAALSDMGYGVRIYTPVGELVPGMAYLVRRLLENSANESFLRRRFQQQEDPQSLLAPPVAAEPTPESPARAAESSPPTQPFSTEPALDFSFADVRDAMRAAVARVRGGLGASFPLVIDGRPVDAARSQVARNPAHPDEIIGRVAQAGPEQAAAAIAGARSAFDAWRRVPVTERVRLLREVARLARDARFDLAALEVLEVGKNWREADADVCEAIDFLEYYSREMERLGPARRLSHLLGEENLSWYVPRGVGVVIAPWNFPLAIPMGMVAAALVAGNTVVFKPSERSPVLAARLADLFFKAGCPAGALQFLPGIGSEIGDLLVDHPQTDFVTFTGSKAVGLRIIERAAKLQPTQRTVKRVIAEMGGKNAIIVDRTADLDEAIPGILASAFGYQGQKCSACSRVIVEQDVADSLVQRLKAAITSLTIGPPEDPASRIGPVIDATARDRIHDVIARGVADGLALYVGATPSLPGFYVAPALFGIVPPDHVLAREEIFGPVLSVLTASDFDRALAVANETDYALTGGVYSRNPANIRKAADAFEVGNLYVNRGITGAIVGRQPFGGFRLSGIGSKAGGPDYLPQFLIPRGYTEHTARHGFAPDIAPRQPLGPAE